MNIKSKIASLNQIPKENIYGVPKGYFDHWTIDRSKILPQGNDAKHPYITPEDFFEIQKIQIENKIFSSESLASMSVPDDYFETLTTRIYTRIEADASETHTVDLYKRLVPYAAAACIVAALLIGRLSHISQTTVVPTVAQVTLMLFFSNSCSI